VRSGHGEDTAHRSLLTLSDTLAPSIAALRKDLCLDVGR
jgi:hypothetical protein